MGMNDSFRGARIETDSQQFRSADNLGPRPGPIATIAKVSQSSRDRISGTYELAPSKNRPPPSKKLPPNPQSSFPEGDAGPLITRPQLRERLGLRSYAQVRYLHDSGRLRSCKQVGRQHYYRERDVEEYVASLSSEHANFGALSARAYRMLGAGKDARDLVQDLEIPPLVAERYCAHYAAAPALFLSRDIIEQIRAIGFGGSGPMGALVQEDFPRQMEQMLKELRQARAHRRSVDRELRQLRAKTQACPHCSPKPNASLDDMALQGSDAQPPKNLR